MASTGTTARSAPRWYAALRGRLQVVAPTPGYRRLWLGALVVTGVLAVWFVLGLGGPPVTKTVSNFALIIAAFSAAAACAWVGLARRTGRERVAFLLFGTGTLSWGLGQAVCVYYESVLGQEVPLPSLADVGYLSMIPLLAAGLLTVPTGAQNMANRARTVLDGLMVAAALLLVSWSMLVQPMLAAGEETSGTLAISLAYPLGDLVIVTIVFYMVARMRQVGAVPLPLTMIGTGIVTFAVADSGYAYLTMTGQYSSGAVTDLGWFAGFTLILLAALCPVENRPSTHRKPTDGRPIALMMPYVVVIVSVVATLVEVLRTGHVDAFVVGHAVHDDPDDRGPAGAEPAGQPGAHPRPGGPGHRPHGRAAGQRAAVPRARAAQLRRGHRGRRRADRALPERVGDARLRPPGRRADRRAAHEAAGRGGDAAAPAGARSSSPAGPTRTR